ncbi:MAG: hypothetical protein V2A70_01255 [Candidatus Omnitrophota bacterium]
MKKVSLTLLSGSIRDFLRAAGAVADSRGVRACLVGGMVRDLLLGVASTDVDVVIEEDVFQTARKLAKQFNAQMTSHEKFRTATLVFKSGLVVDLVTARRETYSKGGALPDVVPSVMKDDILRRDFTINAMAIGLNTGDFGVLYDQAGGFKDLQAKLIRVLHAASFIDDPTRILRAARYAVRFGFQLDALTQDLLDQAVMMDVFKSITQPRYFLEFRRILEEPDPVPALDCLASWNAVRYIPYHAQARAQLIQAGAGGWEERLAGLLSGLTPSRVQEMLAGFNIPCASKKRIMGARQ